jgi:hypothetical protein
MYFRQAGDSAMERLLVNAQPTVDEKISWDNWDGGQAGHRIRLRVPSEIYFSVLANRVATEISVRDVMKQVVSFDHEFIEEVSIELIESSLTPDWRERTGLLIRQNRELNQASDGDLRRLWHQDHFRVFISHRSDFKIQAGALREAMSAYGVSCFVAHDDIEPTREWQVEIEKALFSMEALVALYSPEFHTSQWTDQEIGIAIGRGVPVLPVKCGADPYGFVGKYQGFQAKGKKPSEIAKALFDLLWSKIDLRARLAEGLVAKLQGSTSYQQSNEIMGYISELEDLAPLLIQRIASIARANRQVGEAKRVVDILERFADKIGPLPSIA